mgnify:FL=1|jgi:flavodoxin
MKKTLIIYDSYFGNTKKIAETVEGRLKGILDPSLMQINEFSMNMLNDIQILIAGSPTRGFKPTEAYLNLFKKIPEHALAGIQIAVFDTRIDPADIHSIIFRFIVQRGGYAAPKIVKELTNKGGQLILPPEGFFVEKSEGPLKEGEETRAAAWSEKIISLIEAKK